MLTVKSGQRYRPRKEDISLGRNYIEFGSGSYGLCLHPGGAYLEISFINKSRITQFGFLFSLCYVIIRMLNISKIIENNFLKLKSDYINRAYSIPGKTILKHQDTHKSLLEISLDRKIKSHLCRGKSQISLIFLHGNP